MIVAAVGHVDHGKTALVKALTGVDTDRLPEEKARGMSIELGYAYRTAEDERIVGFIDVPGHERFVRTMVAGVGGIHHALIVIAADDGPMPQTVEHLTILELLGIESGTVVLTKIDRVQPERLAQVRLDIEALLAGTAFRATPIYEVCATRGDGVAALWNRLAFLSASLPVDHSQGAFRLAIDRCFALEGVGCVVTGTVLSGQIAVGDKIIVSPGGMHARVRALRAMGQDAAVGRAGERCSLNLSGTDVRCERISRGDWVIRSDRCSPTNRVDVDLRAAPSATLVRTSSRVHVHIGARESTGRLVLLQESRLEEGRMGFARIILDDHIDALWGDRLVIRDWAARRTVAGGLVLDPLPAAVRIGTRTSQIASLDALRNPKAHEALSALAEVRPDGVDIERFLAGRNVMGSGEEVLRAANVTVRRQGDQRVAFAPNQWTGTRARIIEAVENWHQKSPDSQGLTERELQCQLESFRKAFALHIQALLEDGELVRTGVHLHRPGHSASLPSSDLPLWRRIETLLAADTIRPLTAARIAEDLRLGVPAVEKVLQRALQRRLVIQLPDQRFFAPRAAAQLATAARQLAQRHRDGLFSVAEFRDTTGIGRKLSISVLEYFDRRGLTRREGERRRVVG